MNLAFFEHPSNPLRVKISKGQTNKVFFLNLALLDHKRFEDLDEFDLIGGVVVMTCDKVVKGLCNDL